MKEKRKKICEKTHQGTLLHLIIYYFLFLCLCLYLCYIQNFTHPLYFSLVFPLTTKIVEENKPSLIEFSGKPYLKDCSARVKIET